MTRDTSVAVVGLGSRGLSVIERIVTLAKRAGRAAGRVHVEVIDATCRGSGIHDTDQPDYLLLNSTCSDVSMFPDSHTVGGELDERGPSLYEWASARGLRVADDGFTVGCYGRPVRPTDYLPRRVLGEYLAWFRDHLRHQAPAHVRITLHRVEAVDMFTDRADSLVIACSDGSKVPVHYAFLTTGYTPNERQDDAPVEATRLIAMPYPLPDRLAAVTAGQSVAVAGFGLVAMDVIASLTVGRGGRYAHRDGRLRYLPSDNEPNILLYSRSGVPCRAKPRSHPHQPAGKYQPLLFTERAVDALRCNRGGRLDFQADILPLLLDEMRVAYRLCQARLGIAAPVVDVPRAADRAQLAALLDALDTRLGRFDASSAFEGMAGMSLYDHHAYQRWLTEFIACDLTEGAQGPAGSPLKAAMQVCEDLVDTIRYAIDFGGLADASLDDFMRWTSSQLNRAVVGPQYERHVELLALFEAGVVRAPFGPSPDVVWRARTDRWIVRSSRLQLPHTRAVDWLVWARVPLPVVDASASPLIRSLYRKGWIRRHRPASPVVRSIDVDTDQHPLDSDGRPLQRVWVLGPLCEGVTYYNNLVPEPHKYSRPIFDAHRSVTEMLRRAAGERATRPPALYPAAHASGRSGGWATAPSTSSLTPSKRTCLTEPPPLADCRISPERGRTDGPLGRGALGRVLEAGRRRVAPLKPGHG